MGLTNEKLRTLGVHLKANKAKYGGQAPDGFAWTNQLLFLLSNWKRRPNTAPKQKVLKPLDKQVIVDLLPPDAAAKALDTPGILEALESGDHEMLRTFGMMAKRAGLLTTPQAQELQDELDDTIDDPDYPTEVDDTPPAVQELFGHDVVLTRVDVNLALGRPHATAKDSDGRILIEEPE